MACKFLGVVVSFLGFHFISQSWNLHTQRPGGMEGMEGMAGMEGMGGDDDDDGDEDDDLDNLPDLE